jgi:hypothetical protein
MKQTVKFAFLLVILAALALPGTALARSLQDDRVVAGGSFTLQAGETQDGNLLILGGTVTLEEGSLVNGDVVLMGGTLAVDGIVDGNIIGIGGVVSLRDNAVVNEDVTTIGATLNREQGSVVSGQVVNGFRAPFQFSIPGRVQVPDRPDVHLRLSPLWDGIWFLFRTFMWAALAVLLVMFLPNQAERTARAVVDQPVLAGAVGLLTAVVAPLLLIAMAITIILIPVSLAGGVVLAIAWFLGRIALGLEIGRRIALNARQDWPLAIAAGIGTFVLTFVIDGIDLIVPCVGWLFPALVGMVGLGGVLLTRFGTQNYPSGAAAYPAYPPAPPPAAPPGPPPLAPSQPPSSPPGATIYEAPEPPAIPPASPAPEPGPAKESPGPE